MSKKLLCGIVLFLPVVAILEFLELLNVSWPHVVGDCITLGIKRFDSSERKIFVHGRPLHEHSARASSVAIRSVFLDARHPESLSRLQVDVVARNTSTFDALEGAAIEVDRCPGSRRGNACDPGRTLLLKPDLSSTYRSTALPYRTV